MALLTGHSHYAGQRADRAVMCMAPPRRGICRRVFSRAVVLADGRVTTCDQDFAARQTVGHLAEQPFAELWQSDRLAAIRSDAVADQPLCASCAEWDRP
jgi:radical SAM protein with 4Fe4S-binding SPASM domain